MIISHKHINGIEVLTGENDYIKFETVPEAGGKIISVYNKKLKKEFLWRNENLQLKIQQPGADYDSNFYGGIDELIPNDIPEIVDGMNYPDHGELWTTSLNYEIKEDKISMFGMLELSQLTYQKKISLNNNAPVIHLEYTICNPSASERNFLWKLHAALKIEGGEQLITSAKKAKVVDPYYSRFKNINEFNWPVIEDTDASIVPGKNNSVDFFYLYNIAEAEMNFINAKTNDLFRYSYDKNVFPYQGYFASYGGFLNHYTAILEPATAMPISVNDAIRLQQCTRLKPGETLQTMVTIYAGENFK